MTVYPPDTGCHLIWSGDSLVPTPLNLFNYNKYKSQILGLGTRMYDLLDHDEVEFVAPNEVTKAYVAYVRLCTVWPLWEYLCNGHDDVHGTANKSAKQIFNYHLLAFLS